MNDLKKLYIEKIVPTAMKEFQVSTPLAIPRLDKVVLNIGTGRARDDERLFETMQQTLVRITGQKPVVTIARQSISNFKVRQGMRVGLKVTLRGAQMYDFLQKLIHVTLPRIRDFRGIRPEAIDANGNLNIGIREHNAFPEVRLDEIERLHGLEIAVHLTGKNRERGEYVLRALGFPFAEKGALSRGGATELELNKPVKEVKKGKK